MNTVFAILFAASVFVSGSTSWSLISASHAEAKDSTSSLAEVPCQRTYLKFYGKADLDFRVVFGYKDARPARLVTDRYERLVFIQELMKAGFVRDPSDEELLNFEMVGPDHQRKQIHLRVVESSVGADDEMNKRNPFQKWQSEHARDVFLAGVRDANAVFYVGHSRKGGGPDFDPPRCRPDGHLDYDWYAKAQPGVHAMQTALKSARSGTRLVGLFSCDSDQHFSQNVRALAPELGLIDSASVLYYTDSIENTVDVIKNLTHFKCRPELLPPGVEMRGFFH